MKYERLNIAALTLEQKSRTCGYWYTVSNMGTAHTAFETKAAALAWLLALGLSIDGDLPEDGTHAYFEIKGSYRRELFNGSEEAFKDLAGIPAVVLENGSYRPGKLQTVDGNRVLYAVNCNCRWAEKYDYQTCRQMKREGVTIF